MARSAIEVYGIVRRIVVAAGWRSDIEWQASVRVEDATEHSFLRELAFVILNSGMRAAVVAKHWPRLRDWAFLGFESARVVKLYHDSIRTAALSVFNNETKVDAILDAAHRVDTLGWPFCKEQLLLTGTVDVLRFLSSFRYIGPVIMYHLAKNLGVQVAKPDRHLWRIAEAFGYDDVQRFCGDVAAAHGDNVSVVDLVWWRFAASVEPGAYLDRINEWIG